MFRKEVKIYLTAVMFLTRIRVPAQIDHHPDYLQKCPKYFPMVGWIVGAISAVSFLVFNRFFSPDIALLASIIAGLFTTGAFHEDGFADVCDGFGGGWTREKILLIMKDSRIGAFGAIGLITVLGAKFLLLKEIVLLVTPSGKTYDFIGCLLAAHSLSRLLPVFIVRFFEYAADPDTSKSKPVTNRKPGLGEMVFSTVTALLPFVFLPWPFFLTILPAILVAYRMARYFKKWINGYTGDCLGAIQQVSELAFYLSFILVWKYSP